MSQLRFEGLSERLLHAGIAPRWVRRYIDELRDHFDDLLREEAASGVAHQTAETRALSRLGHEDDLADIVLAHPDLRSITSRFPWAVFVLGSAAMVVAALAIGLVVEIATLDLISARMPAFDWKAGPGILRWFTLGIEAWNMLTVDIAPLGAAALLYAIGTRQRVSFGWILAGMAIACFLGGFQHLSWYDTGTRGVMTFNSGLFPPFSHFTAGIGHAVGNFVLVTVGWWFAKHRSVFQ